ncbi:DJ-1/PfpI family protein [Paludibacterium yongneupense]|uniref:DJ-1/PfpI family protein n=1 Tax=Paludibacterium yongneupense TaxID=400061 RepID=UPI0003FBC973|nr:DJ-1/PfpI family protein [Paludibacterium yongneupense]
MPLQIGFLLFPQVQQLDLLGPYDVLAALPGVELHLIWKTLAPVASSSGVALTADATYASSPALDVICVPGGAGIADLMSDEETLDFIRRQAAGARFVTSVCTGALLLGAAGLLRGRRATTHWAFHDLLALLGALPVHERVVRDGMLITGGGITAGIDFALVLAAELVGVEEAQAVQLELEYAPAPPFDAGSPLTAAPAVLALVRQRNAASVAQRRDIALRAAAALDGPLSFAVRDGS